MWKFLSVSICMSAVLCGFPFQEASGKIIADTVLSDAEYWSALNLNYPGLEVVRDAVIQKDYEQAKSALCAYYRQRGAGFWSPEAYQKPDEEMGLSEMDTFQNIEDRKGLFSSKNWISTDEFNWKKTSSRDRRMYLFSSMGRAYRYSGNEEIAKVWINLFRAWIRQMPAKWNRLQTGIRLKSGWGDAFCSFINSPSLDDESLFLYLKAYYEQALYLRNEHSDTSNWLTFEMGGLYAAAVLFPELKSAEEWRDYVLDVAIADLDKGWLPDGLTIELTPGYGQFFKNYLDIVDRARVTGNVSPELDDLVSKTERLYVPYLELMAPDGKAPAFQDNQAVDVRELMGQALERFPERKDFRWASTGGREGAEPGFLSTALPYAGYLAIRSGWEWNANYLCFDAGPVGYRHAHQDKLNVVMWAYGRQILFDPGRHDYAENAYQNYCVDTFSHSTGVVDNRPQRRKWYNHPSPENMPYEKAEGFEYEIGQDAVWGCGVYSDQYGRAGSIGTDSYPYKKGGNFKENLGKPALQYRQVSYVAPDVFIVQDWFVPNDSASHKYEIRWQLDSVDVVIDDDRVRTTDSYKPNLEIIPLNSQGLHTETVSAQNYPEIMGWKVDGREGVPATTVRHMKQGRDGRLFATLLFPLKPGADASGVTVSQVGDAIVLKLRDGRSFRVLLSDSPEKRLEINSLQKSE